MGHIKIPFAFEQRFKPVSVDIHQGFEPQTFSVSVNIQPLNQRRITVLT